MRGEARGQRSMLMVIDAEKRVPKQHPIRRIRNEIEKLIEQFSRR